MSSKKILLTIAATATALIIVGFTLIVVNARVNADKCSTMTELAKRYDDDC